MTKPLLGTKVAVLVANGFDEKDLTFVQRALVEQGATIKIVSINQGLVNGWDEGNWGHNYAVDAQLNSALGVDFQALIIPGGHRSIEKLKLTAHSKRFIGSFLAAMKPVAVVGDAVDLMAHNDQLTGRQVSGPEGSREMAEKAGAVWMEAPYIIDASMMSGIGGEDKQFASTMIEHFIHNAEMAEAA